MVQEFIPVSVEAPPASPAAALISTTDRLQITSFCSVSSIELAITGIIVLPDGSIQEISELHTPNSDRSASTSRFSLTPGFIQFLQVRVSSGTLVRGQCYVQVGIVRALAGANVLISTLIASYVTSTYFPTYPLSPHEHSFSGRGNIRSITGTDPAAGSEISETVPTNAVWRLYSVRFTFVTDSNVASRIVELTISDSSNTLISIPSNYTHNASLTRTYNFANFGLSKGLATTNLLDPLFFIILFQSYIISTVTANIQSTDNFSSPQLLVEEWLIE